MAASIDLTDEFRRALDLLEAGSNVFLTGKAGTGKSTLIREFISRTERNVVVTAPTGIAALNVDGYTLHRLFGLHPSISLSEVQSGRYYPARFAETLKALETLIVDEVSMVRADLFDQVAAALERFGPKPGQPFGGVQVVLVGDLLQLPPVVTEHEQTYFETEYHTPYFFSAHNYSRELFPSISLTKVFRQLGDTQMTSILNSIREGLLLETAQQDLNAHVDANFEPLQDEFWLTLTTTNRIASARNRQRLERLSTELHVHHAHSTGELEGFEPPTDEALEFKIGAQVMMLTNHPGDQWANGTLGQVEQIGRTRFDETCVAIRLQDNDLVWASPHT
ncbi:AAA family ATPase [Nesterenkonia flava]|uniref:AAA family ATPase n=1 Tax=Nesterenkonia flava TaxID=469799 RepID=A0ABU1FSE7_9MICC|nr:AAA family ATPase [Nesterenkonia flava]MDR5711595.1 AAA family ATPase [Nesterenkonia flava]